jgi:hypothetical protein
MAGSAGSKYGVIDEGVPLKKGITKIDNSPKELKNLRIVIRSLLQKNKTFQAKP